MYMDPTNLQDSMNNQRERPAIGLFKFTVEPVIDLETGDMAEVEWVEWSKIGDRYESTTKEKIARVRGNPAKGKAPMAEWSVVEPYYEAWKKGKVLEQDGTPFSEWKGVDSRLVEVLRGMQIFTVEAFASVPSHNVSGIRFPNVSRWHEFAKRFVAERGGREAMRAELAARDAKIAELEAAVRAMQSVDGERRGPGRPRKVETVEAE